MTVAPGLRGDTPLGFLASLGLQSAYLIEPHPPSLHFDADRSPVLGTDAHIGDIASQVLRAAHDLADSDPVAQHHDVKFKGTTAAVRQAARGYLATAAAGSPLAARLAMSLSVEGATNSRGDTAKPSLLHFGGPKIAYLSTLRDSIDTLDTETIEAALQQPHIGLSRFRWGATDGRSHARERRSPSDDRDRRRMLKLHNPALSALAMLGLVRYPSWLGARKRVLTAGCVASGRSGSATTFVWPLWSQPFQPPTVDAVLGSVRPDPSDADGERYAAWGIREIRAASIIVDEYSYGRFAPTSVIWRTERTSTPENP